MDLEPEEAVLSISQEHLLKRELLRQQVSVESAGMDNMVNIDKLGPPFVLPNGQIASGDNFPLFSYFLHYFIVSFPLLKGAKTRFWTDVCQPFVQSLASKDISSTADRDEATKRRRIGRILKRLILMMYVAGLGSNRIKSKSDTNGSSSDEVSTISKSQTPEADLGERATESDVTEEKPQIHPGPYASVIGVREFIPSGLFKTGRHSEYILESHFYGGKPVWVVRSWTDFLELDKRLTQAFPGKALQRLPRKNSTDTTALINGEKLVLMRESQRITLRFYLQRLCSNPKVANSPPFLDFLFNDPIGELSAEEIKDIESRIELDKNRAKDRELFYELADARQKKLDKDLSRIKKEILLENALPRIFLEMKTHSKVEDMSPLLQIFVDWCRVQFGSLIYDTLIARDDSPEIFSQLKRLHKLMPYLAIQGILKLSNPALIFKKLTDLFMATPFGGKSLIQKMLIRILSDDIRSQEVLIAELEERVQNKNLISAINEYTYMDHWTREAVIRSAEKDNIDLTLAIIQMQCSDQAEVSKVRAWHKEWQNAVVDLDENKAAIEETPEVDKYSQLKDLLKLKVRQRDKDILREFWGDQLTIKFIRAIVDLVYDVLIDIFRYGGVSQSVGDFERFMSDLIEYIEFATASVSLNAHQLVDQLLEVLRKHQNSLFRFINRVYHRDTGFFIDLVNWMTLFVHFIQDGKAGKHKLDILGLVESSKSIDIIKLREELTALQTWLDRRRATAKDPAVTIKLDDFPVAGNKFDVTDVGLSLEDVDFGLAEVEVDEQEEFIPEMRIDLSQDAVTRDRNRLRKQKLMEARKEVMKPRPEMTETAKLVPDFTKELYKVLHDAVIEPMDISNLSLEDFPLPASEADLITEGGADDSQIDAAPINSPDAKKP